jgi:pheromone shutdown-related protein TraB
MYKKPKIEEVEQNLHLIDYEEEGKKIYLIGTAHVSPESVKQVKETILKYQPDTVAIELDEKRYESITKKDKYEDINLIEIIKKKQIFFFIGQFIMSLFQKKIAEKTKSAPGQEFKTAIEVAEEINAKLALVDRDVGITLKRAWRLTKFLGKMKLLASLIFSSSSKQDITMEDIEQLKGEDALTKMISEMGDEMPMAKKAIIDERDMFLTGMIQEKMGDITVAAVGAGHVPGMLKYFEERRISQEELKEINFVPEPSLLSKSIPWIIPMIVIGVFIYGFTKGDGIPTHAIMYWILANGILSALGALIALGHPLTIIASFIAAPITSLNPTIGAGMVSGLVQAMVVPPKVKDFQTVQDDAMKIKGWWGNRLTRLLLVVLLSSLGSAIGTFVALPALMSIFK